MMLQRARRTELQRTVSGLFWIESRVSIAFPLFMLFTIVRDYIIGYISFVNTTFQVGDHLSIQHQQKLKCQQ